MADGNGTFGGGGSVRWAINVNDGDFPNMAPKPSKPRGYTIGALDKHESMGRFFEVTIEIPPSGLWYVVENGKAKIYLEIVNQTNPQIDVHWALPDKPTNLDSLT